MGDSSPDSLFLNPEIFGILKHHVLFENHEKEQPYFEKRANLNRHIRRIYENITPFQCRACELKKGFRIIPVCELTLLQFMKEKNFSKAPIVTSSSNVPHVALGLH